ncbi:tripeptidyl-peptidase [Aureococcus anophagefferens]|nr:tripeptidyl-peptidase [Aureococcus anophagefferens]
MEFRLGAKRTDALWPAALRAASPPRTARASTPPSPPRQLRRCDAASATRQRTPRARRASRRSTPAARRSSRAASPRRRCSTSSPGASRRPARGAASRSRRRGGDLVAGGVTVLGDFRVATAAGERSSRWGTFGDEDLLTCSASFYEGGDVVALVVPAGDHGTHVAAIVGAYDAADPDKCGVAPACRIVSIKIGDSRLGTMETGAGLCRALVACRRLGVDLVNLSYGEAACLCDVGRFVELSESSCAAATGAPSSARAGNNGRR